MWIDKKDAGRLAAEYMASVASWPSQWERLFARGAAVAADSSSAKGDPLPAARLPVSE